MTLKPQPAARGGAVAANGFATADDASGGGTSGGGTSGGGTSGGGTSGGGTSGGGTSGGGTSGGGTSGGGTSGSGWVQGSGSGSGWIQGSGSGSGLGSGSGSGWIQGSGSGSGWIQGSGSGSGIGQGSGSGSGSIQGSGTGSISGGGQGSGSGIGQGSGTGSISGGGQGSGSGIGQGSGTGGGQGTGSGNGGSPGTGTGSGGGSGSNSTNASAAPPLAVSGGWSASGGSVIGNAPSYTIKQVPVGAIISLTLVSPNNGFTIDTASITWANGTDIKGYTSQSASDRAPDTMSVSTGVDTHSLTYTFIVDAKARAYNIQVSAKYSNIGNMTQPKPTTIQFTSVRPQIATLKAGDQLGIPRSNTNGNQFQLSLRSDFGRTPNNKATKGMVIVATTTIAANAPGGSFMFLQTANIVRSKIDGGQPFHERNVGTGPNVDNSFPGQGGAPGYPIDLFTSTITPNQLTPNSWRLDSVNGLPSTGMHTMNDTPTSPSSPAATTTKLSIGSFAPVGPAQPESYTTYLMYKPDSGVWIALNKLNWGWQIMLTAPTVKVSGQNFYYDKTGTDVTDEWPSWTGATSNILTQGWVPGP